MKAKTKEIIFAIIALIIVESFSLFIIEKNHIKILSQYLDKQTEELENNIKATQYSYSLLASSIFEQAINTPKVLQIYSKAHNANELQKTIIRDSLYKILLPVYKHLKLNNIKQIQFHLPNNESFLRFHLPNKYGDKLSEARYSVKMVNSFKKKYSGFEEGKTGYGFSNIFPLSYQKQHIGSVEIVFSFESLKMLLQKFGDKTFGFIINKDFINTKSFSKSEKEYNSCGISDNYMYKKRSTTYSNDSLKILKQINESIKSKISNKLGSNRNFSVLTNINKQYYLISFYSVKNIEGNHAAYIISYIEDNIIEGSFINYWIYKISSFILLIILTIFIYLYFKRKRRAKEIDNDYKSILDASNDIIFIISQTGKQLYFNNQLNTLLGYNNNDLIGKLFINFIPKSEVSKYSEMFKNAISSDQIITFETFALHKNGKQIPVEVTGKTLVHNGESVVIGTTRDITKRKKAEQEIRKLSIAIEQSHSTIVITDASGNIEFANPYFTKTTGYTFDEAKGQNPRILKSDHTTKEEYVKLWDTIVSGETWQGEFLNVKKNKETYWEKAIISAVKDENGKISNFIAIKEDITARKKTEQALIESEKKFRELFEESGDENLILGDGNIIDCNKSLLKLLHYKTKEGLLMVHPSKISPEFQEDGSKSIDKANEMIRLAIENKTHRFEWLLMNSNGEIIETEVLLTSINNKGKIIHAVLRDIGYRKDVKRKLIEAKNQAMQANKLKSEFLANMSHEIRTPMNAVLGFSDILNNKLSNNAECQPLIQGIINGGKNLTSLINDILDLSKIEAGRLEIIKEPVNILDLIEDIKQIFSVTLKNKNIILLLDIDKRFPNSLLLDKTRIRQILFNLVGNAIKFTEKGSVTISAKIDKYIRHKSKVDLIIEVRDTGIGIPNNQVDILFDPFIQIKNQDNKYGGTGLGLSITKRLTEAMNGEISVKSELGKGSVFSINFKSITRSKINPIKELRKLQKENILFKNPQILIVDDIKSSRNITKVYLEAHNCTVYETTNGQEAIDFIKENKPDLILMDIQMPILDGYEATKQIKKQEEFNKIPIVALTAKAMKTQEKEYRKVFDDYLIKPITSKEIINSLMQFLPYTKTESSKKVKPYNYYKLLSESIEKNGKLPSNFIKIYKIELLPIFEDISDIMDMTECKKFARILIEEGKKYKIEIIIKFGLELKSAIENFQLNKIEQLLTEFSKIKTII